jgi:phage terminase large subunit GpA-like protein
LESHIFRKFESEDGREMEIRATAIDSGGHFTNSVYQFCKKHTGRRVFAIKGIGGDGKPIVGRPSKNNIARCPLFSVGVNTVKDLLFARMKIKELGAGYIHFSDELDDEYFKMLTAEKAVTKYHKGFKRREYIKLRPRNEALDCFVYSIAAYAIIGVNVNALADRLKAESVKKVVKPEKESKKAKNKSFVPKTGRNFINSWR